MILTNSFYHTVLTFSTSALVNLGDFLRFPLTFFFSRVTIHLERMCFIMRMTFDGYKINEFEFEGIPAKLICPENPIGRVALKTEYWEAFPDVEICLLEKGFHIAYLKNSSRFAPRKDCDAKARFIKFLAKEYGVSEKCVPIGMSLGGSCAIRFAGFYPELVSCIFLDAPVVDYCSLGSFKIGSTSGVWQKEILPTYPGLRHYQVASFSENPVNMVEILVENKIPVVMSYGLQDASVIYKDHGALLEEAYEGTDLLLTIPVEYRGHHPHGLMYGNGKIVDFIINHTKG